jgi:L-amino acid N-acyltransferase YncA
MLTGSEIDAFLAGRDGPHGAALVVEEVATGRILGLARSSPVAGDPDAAEVSAVVSDAHQQRGLGTWLLQELIGLERERGIERLVATSDGSNVAAGRLLRREHFLVVGHDLGTLTWQRTVDRLTWLAGGQEWSART